MSSEPTPATRSRRAAGRWLTVGGLLLGAGLLALVLARTDLATTWTQLRRLDPLWLAIPLAAGIASLVFRAWRWRLIFSTGARPTFWGSFWTLGVGNLLNLLLPARAGDLLRCGLTGRGESGGHVGTALAALTLEKILDGLAALLVLGLASRLLSVPPWFIYLSRSSAIAFGVASVVLILLRWQAPRVETAIRAVAGRTDREALGERVVTLAERFHVGLDAVASPAQVLPLVLLTAAVWAAEAASAAGLAMALGMSLGLANAAVAISVLALGMMIPAAPGYVGTYEFFSVSVLEMFGIAPGAALALTLVMHAWAYNILLAVGLACLAAGGRDWRRLKPLPNTESQGGLD